MNNSLSDMFLVDLELKPPDDNFVFLKTKPPTDPCWVNWSFFRLLCVEDKDLLFDLSLFPFLKVLERDFDFFISNYYLYKCFRGFVGAVWIFFGVYSLKIFETWNWVETLLFVKRDWFAEDYTWGK